jgi:hypothetical protein
MIALALAFCMLLGGLMAPPAEASYYPRLCSGYGSVYHSGSAPGVPWYQHHTYGKWDSYWQWAWMQYWYRDANGWSYQSWKWC